MCCCVYFSCLTWHFYDVDTTSMDHTENDETAVIEELIEAVVKGQCEGLMVKTLDDNASYQPNADRSTGWKYWYRISRHWFLLSMLTRLSSGHVVDCGKMLEFIIWLFMTASRFRLVQFSWIIHACSIPTFYK